MTMTEFPVNLDDIQEGQGTLIITDPQVLIRPAVPGQYPASVKHSSAHAYDVLSLAYDDDQHRWHILCREDANAAHALLDRVFYAFIDACCLQLWCDARVTYLVDGDTVRMEEYGFEDGNYTLFFTVHCNVAEGDIDRLVTELTADAFIGERFVVVRPDNSELGYAAQGLAVH